MKQMGGNVDLHGARPVLTPIGLVRIGESHSPRFTGGLQPRLRGALGGHELQALQPSATQYPSANPGPGPPIQHVIIPSSLVPITRELKYSPRGPYIFKISSGSKQSCLWYKYTEWCQSTYRRNHTTHTSCAPAYPCFPICS